MRERWAYHTVLIIGAVLVFVVVSTAAQWPWWEYAFLSDDSALSWLSSALLLANAAVVAALTIASVLAAPVGIVLTAGFAIMAIDEQFLLHERWQGTVGGVFGVVPTLLIGVGGIVLLPIIRKAIKSRPARLLIAAGVGLGLMALWVDLGSPPALLSRTEELYEVFAETLVLCGLLEAARRQVQSAA